MCVCDCIHTACCCLAKSFNLCIFMCNTCMSMPSRFPQLSLCHFAHIDDYGKSDPIHASRRSQPASRQDLVHQMRLTASATREQKPFEIGGQTNKQTSEPIVGEKFAPQKTAQHNNMVGCEDVMFTRTVSHYVSIDATSMWENYRGVWTWKWTAVWNYDWTVFSAIEFRFVLSTNRLIIACTQENVLF